MSWKVPRIWEDSCCWVIGGGRSLINQLEIPEDIVERVMKKELPLSAYSDYFEPIRNDHIIAVNSAFLLGDWIDVMFFGDINWFLHNRYQLRKFPGLKVSCHNRFQGKTREEREDVKYVERDREKPYGLSDKKYKVSWNYNSGACAINLAYHFGVKTVFLLGFDMKPVDNQTHWHNEYGKKTSKTVFEKHLKGFPFIKADAERLGLKIYNVNPDSAIQEFEKVSLKEILKNGIYSYHGRQGQDEARC